MLTPLKRSLLGLLLCLIRQYSSGLRELSLALELSPLEDGSKRILLLLYLYVGLETTSQQVLANRVYNQIEQEDKFGLLRIFENMDIEDQQLMPLFDVPKLEMNTNRFKSQLFKSHSIVCINISRFRKVYGGHHRDKVILYLKELFDLVISLSPLENFDKFRSIQSDVREIELVSEVHYGKVMTKGFKNNRMVLDALKNLIITKTLFAYLSLNLQKYEDSYHKFDWILKQLVNLIESYQESDLVEFGFTKLVFNSISLLLSKALIHTTNHLKNKTNIQMCLFQIIAFTDSTEQTTDSKQFSLDYYFTVVGLLYLESGLCNHFKLSQNSFLPNKSDLEESIRKMIIVSALKAVDDSSIIYVYQVILSTLVLFGDVNLKLIWFFNFLKHYFHIRVSVNDQMSLRNYLSPSSKNLLYATSTYLKEFTKLEKSYNRSPRRKKDLELPIVQIDIGDDGSAISVKPFNGKLPYSLSKEQKFAKSQEFFDLWIISYKNYQGDIPIQIQTYIEYLNSDT